MGDTPSCVCSSRPSGKCIDNNNNNNNNKEEEEKVATHTSGDVDYSNRAYWNKRYARAGKKFFDWYVDYASMKELLASICSKKDHILQIGCGNSKMLQDMWADGYQGRTVGTDISDFVVASMVERYKGTPFEAIQFQAVDASDMSQCFGDNSFDLVIEKGTIDALVCDDGTADIMNKILKEAHRVLRPGGKLVLVSHSAPVHRLPLLQVHDWQVRSTVLPYSTAALLIRELRRENNGAAISSTSPEIMAKCLLRVREIVSKPIEDVEAEAKKTPDEALVCFCYICTK